MSLGPTLMISIRTFAMSHSGGLLACISADDTILVGVKPPRVSFWAAPAWIRKIPKLDVSDACGTVCQMGLGQKAKHHTQIAKDETMKAKVWIRENGIISAQPSILQHSQQVHYQRSNIDHLGRLLPPCGYERNCIFTPAKIHTCVSVCALNAPHVSVFTIFYILWKKDTTISDLINIS